MVNMLTADQRTKVYEDRSKVIAEMAEAFYIFSRSIFFNLEMAEQYNLSCNKYFSYLSQIVWNIDIFLQEDQLMCTKAGFSLVPVSRLPPQQQWSGAEKCWPNHPNSMRWGQLDDQRDASDYAGWQQTPTHKFWLIFMFKCFVMVVGSFQLKMLSVRQGTQHFTDENKVSRKWSDSVHLMTP